MQTGSHSLEPRLVRFASHRNQRSVCTVKFAVPAETLHTPCLNSGLAFTSFCHLKCCLVMAFHFSVEASQWKTPGEGSRTGEVCLEVAPKVVLCVKGTMELSSKNYHRSQQFYHTLQCLGNIFGHGVRIFIIGWIYAFYYLQRNEFYECFYLKRRKQQQQQQQREPQFLLPYLLHSHSILMWFIPETDSFSFPPGSCQCVLLVNGENQRSAQAQCHDSFLAFQGFCNGNYSSKLQFLPSEYVNVNETKHSLHSFCITLTIDSVSAYEVITHACLNTTILF